MDAAKRAHLKSRMKEAAQKREKRIDSPLVRYNELDQPVCKVCNVAVKSESLWPAHLVSRQHKEAVERYKTQAKAVAAKPVTNNITSDDADKAGARVSSSLPEDFWDQPDSKRTAQVEDIPADKELNTIPSEKQSIARKIGSVQTEKQAPRKKDETEKQVVGRNAENIISEVAKPVVQPPTQDGTVTGKGVLPEGFFDNVDADYKARGLEPPKFDIQDEWKEFQKAIRDDIQEVDLRLEEEEYDAAEEREDLERLQQSELLERVEKLRKRELQANSETTEITEVIAKVVSKKPFSNLNLAIDEDSASDDDDEEEDGLLDWRAKQF